MPSSILQGVRKFMNLRLWKRTPSPVKVFLPGFDKIFYMHWYRDVLQYHGTPAEHYLYHGWREGRDPSAGFSTLGYLASNPDVARSGENPLVHFVNFGLAEGRTGYQKEAIVPPPLLNTVLRGPQQLLSPYNLPSR